MLTIHSGNAFGPGSSGFQSLLLQMEPHRVRGGQLVCTWLFHSTSALGTEHVCPVASLYLRVVYQHCDESSTLLNLLFH